MRYFFAFLYRNRVLLLFLFLQAIAISLIYRHRSFQRSVILNSSNALSGSILQKYNGYLQYLDLEQQNERLAKDNARLRSLQRNSYFPITKSTADSTDTIYKIRYQYLTANVINSSYLKVRNYITIDKGSVHGIKREMGVTGPDGVVGIVQHVSKNFSTVIPLINPSITLSGKFKRQGYFGPVSWRNNDYQHITLTDIPRYAEVKKGDTIITDSRSLIFPAGILIGVVESNTLQQDQNFLSIQLALSTDFSSLQQVFVIKDKMKLELQNLEATNGDEE